jgi:[acyl-carrier-protein] S-malonyltransferase
VGEIVFLFPGQGSQKVGMGSDLLAARPEVFDRFLAAADEASGLPIRKLALEGPIEELTSTDAAQPALFAVSLAVAECARDLGLSPSFVAGHSLGEYTAAVAAGAVSFEDGMRLVALRGKLMAEIQNERPGAMAAVIGLPIERLRELCEETPGLVRPANHNTPTQIVVSGEDEAVTALGEKAREAGADKVVRLSVGAAFHSSLMEPVQAKMAEAMQDVAWSDADVPVAANASGGLVQSADDVRQALIDQIASPVLFVDCVRTLAEAGADTYLELGPGRVLSGLVRQILGMETDASSADSPAKLEKFASAHAEAVSG